MAEDPLLFTDEAFRLEPMEGDVWAHSEVESVLMFCPHTAHDYRCARADTPPTNTHTQRSPCLVHDGGAICP